MNIIFPASVRLKIHQFGLIFVILHLSACTLDHAPTQLKPKVATITPASQPPICECAAPPPPATYLVYFEPSKIRLQPKALSTLAMVNVDDRKLSFGHIYISAFIDSSDAPSNAKELALARARAVEEQLVVDGISKSKLEIVSNSVVNRYVDPGFADPRIVPIQYRRIVEIQADKTRFGTTNFLPFNQPK